MKYYETIIKVRILSTDTPFGEAVDLPAIDYAISEGDCMGTLETEAVTELTGKAMAQRSRDFGGDPGFFFLDNDGNETDG